ncbi:hypothetical protein [Nonomuraea sp. NPDC050643]|uniref:hypothetical protein n=1 Tax=Nonomuraea sp. NPDC050643 TaxID=3155660 RepID=UPI0033C8CD32
MSRRAALIGAGAILIGVVATACGVRDGTNGEPPPPTGPTPVITAAAQISLPLDGHRLTLEEDLLLQRAEGHLVVVCMARFGVTYEPPEPRPGLSSAGHERLYGLLDPEIAANWGYTGENSAGLGTAQARPPAPERHEELLTGSPERGTGPDGGCVGEARRDLAAGSQQADENLIIDLAYVAGVRAEADGRVRAAFARWSACMAAAGFDYEDPWEPNNHPWPHDDGTVSRQEKAVATADVRCKHETNLAGVWNTVAAAHQRRLIEQHGNLLSALERARGHRLERAAGIMSDADAERRRHGPVRR